MTEQEFMRQIWRPYDTVEIEGGFVGKVTNVCFSNRSVKVSIKNSVYEWVKHDLIIKHTSMAGHPDDLAVIEELHEKIIKSEDKHEGLQNLIKNQALQIDRLKAKINDLELQASEDKSAKELKELRCAINNLSSVLVEKKKKIELIDKAINKIHNLLEDERE
jgi:predicted RNase H-like nuclease (RuvC/YqgF family)